MTVEFDVESEVKETKIIENLKDILRISMETMENTARRIVPVRTGDLRDSITLENIDDFHINLVDGVSYGVHVEFGTEPHLILPKNKMALKFESGGQTVFTKRVNHPGTNPKPFFRPALDDVKFMVMPRLFLERFG